MLDEKKQLRDYIRNFHKMEIVQGDSIEIDDFFNLDKPLTNDMDQVYNAVVKHDDGTLFNEIMTYVDDNYSLHESMVLLCLFRGMTYKQVGKLFNKGEYTIRRYEREMLNRFIEDSH